MAAADPKETLSGPPCPAPVPEPSPRQREIVKSRPRLRELASGTQAPKTKDERAFVAVVSGEKPPETELQYAYLAVVAHERFRAAFHGWRRANRAGKPRRLPSARILAHRAAREAEEVAKARATEELAAAQRAKAAERFVNAQHVRKKLNPPSPKPVPALPTGRGRTGR